MVKSTRSGDERTMIVLTIKDKSTLHNYYMPFIRDGGLFIPNSAEYDLGDEVSIHLNLMDESEQVAVAGKVVWVAKKGVKSPHSPGVGIQFIDPNNMAKDKIETYLAGSLGSPNTTATM